MEELRWGGGACTLKGDILLNRLIQSMLCVVGVWQLELRLEVRITEVFIV